jgi:hypothetical protein
VCEKLGLETNDRLDNPDGGDLPPSSHAVPGEFTGELNDRYTVKLSDADTWGRNRGAPGHTVNRLRSINLCHGSILACDAAYGKYHAI